MRTMTVTLNPALDKTASVDALLPGELNRMRDVIVDGAGKGINVSKVLRALGGESVATGFIGGGSGEEIIRSLDAWGIRHDFVRIAGTNRTNLKVLDRGNTRLTELNEPGPAIAPAEYAALLAKLEAFASPDALFVFSGSIPAGVGTDAYAQMLRLVRGRGARAFLDADGAVFKAAVVERPEFIKPNRFEILQYHGLVKDGWESTPNDVILRLCRGFIDGGIGRMAVSMGKDGALFVSADDAFLCPGLDVKLHSTVGAGDSLVAGMALGEARGLPWREAAALALATSAGAVTTEGTKPPSRDLVESLVRQVRFIEV